MKLEMQRIATLTVASTAALFLIATPLAVDWTSLDLGASRAEAKGDSEGKGGRGGGKGKSGGLTGGLGDAVGGIVDGVTDAVGLGDGNGQESGDDGDGSAPADASGGAGPADGGSGTDNSAGTDAADGGTPADGGGPANAGGGAPADAPDGALAGAAGGGAPADADAGAPVDAAEGTASGGTTPGADVADSDGSTTPSGLGGVVGGVVDAAVDGVVDAVDGATTGDAPAAPAADAVADVATPTDTATDALVDAPPETAIAEDADDAIAAPADTAKRAVASRARVTVNVKTIRLRSRGGNGDDRRRLGVSSGSRPSVAAVRPATDEEALGLAKIEPSAGFAPTGTLQSPSAPSCTTEDGQQQGRTISCLVAGVEPEVGAEQIAYAAPDAPVDAPPAPALGTLPTRPNLYDELYGLQQVEARRYADGGVPVLVVQGVVSNMSNGRRSVPPLVAIVQDDQGRELLRWTFRAEARSLAAGASTGFRSEMFDPQSESAKVTIVFAAVQQTMQ